MVNARPFIFMFIFHPCFFCFPARISHLQAVVRLKTASADSPLILSRQLGSGGGD